MSEILTDGHPTFITFSAGSSGITLTDIMKEKEVTPPGMQGGGANDTTSMRNTVYRTFQPKSLITVSESSFTAFYDPALLDEIVAMLNVNQQLTITFPDDSTWVIWGWLDSFVPDAVSEGTPPMATVTIIPSNQNSDGEETPPVYSA